MARIFALAALLGVLVLSAWSEKVSESKPPVPLGFVDLQETIPGLKVDIRYHSANNFLWHPVDGYAAPRALATKQVALALAKVQASLQQDKLGLLVFDAYRPQRAVDQFVRWAGDHDRSTKADYYPRVSKPDLLRQEYIAAQSGHSRGSAIDLTLIDLNTNEPLDMGTRFDFFDPLSNLGHASLTQAQRANRQRLQRAMTAHGFAPYQAEWWHFSLKPEPYPKRYFDFPIR